MTGSDSLRESTAGFYGRVGSEVPLSEASRDRRLQPWSRERKAETRLGMNPKLRLASGDFWFSAAKFKMHPLTARLDDRVASISRHRARVPVVCDRLGDPGFAIGRGPPEQAWTQTRTRSLRTAEVATVHVCASAHRAAPWVD